MSHSSQLIYSMTLFKFKPWSLDEDAADWDDVGIKESEHKIWSKVISSQSVLTTEPDWWPVDRLEKIFLPRAVRKIGRHRFGKRWIDLNFDSLKSLASLWEDINSGNLVPNLDDAVHFPTLYRLVRAYAELTPGIETSDFSNDYDIHTIKQAVQRYFRYLALPLSFYRQIENELVEGMCSGWVGSYSRAQAGGPYVVLNGDLWLRDNWEVQLRDGVTFSFPRTETDFIFIPEIDVTLARKGTERAATTETQPPKLGYVSPYMTLILTMTHELGITKSHQPMKKVLERWIHENWERFFDTAPKERPIGYLATFGREPESQRGVHRKKQQAPKK